jgi:pimeloyl-ACP methyl ester carboxylesterase
MVDIGELSIHVAEAGRGEPLLMLHGWPQHWYMWHHVLPELARHYHVYCPDLRGFGWSDAPPRGYDKEQLATDVLELMDALNIGPVRLVGHDWGAFAAFLVCLREPDRIERYLALNMVTPWLNRPAMLRNLHRSWYQVVMASGLGNLVLKSYPGAVKAALRAAAVKPGTWEDGEVDIYIDRIAMPGREQVNVELYRQMLLHEGPAILAGKYAGQRLEVPTLLLFGEADAAISPAMVMGFEDHADEMRLELVPGCGHFIANERPDLVLEAALRFFA